MEKRVDFVHTIGILGLMLVVSGGCAYSELTPEGSRVITAPNLQIEQCRYIGVVIGKGGGGGGGWVRNEELVNYAMNDLRNKAAKMGATHVVTGNPQLGSADGTTNSATVTGTAYDCSAVRH